MVAAPHVSGLSRAFLVLTCLGLVSACGKPEPVSESKAPEQTASTAGKKPLPLKECAEAKPGGPEDVVRTLYQQYSFAGKKALVNEPQEVLDKYLDTRFASALLMNQACEEDTSEVCAIDYDFMYEAQDAEVSDLKVCAMDAASSTGEVQFKNRGEPQSVTYELNKTAAGWRIADIGSVVATIEKYYQNLEKGWEKAQGPEIISEKAKNKEPLPHCEPAQAGGPEGMVRSLYEQYPWQGDRIIINEPREVLQKYFDETMVKAITDNHARRTAEHHSFLPMTNIMINQEMNYVQDISGLRICAMDAAAKTINVQFRDAGEPRIVTYKLVGTPAGQRIAGVYATEGAHPEESGKGQWSLAEALSGPLPH